MPEKYTNLSLKSCWQKRERVGESQVIIVFVIMDGFSKMK